CHVGLVTFGALAACACGALVLLRAQWLRWAMPADTRAAGGTPMPAPGMTHLAE
ncbi:MFS transporter, partial [Burkholderia pseudomallei]|nr:MFS transporter [Burkholderia pseudomallei]